MESSHSPSGCVCGGGGDQLLQQTVSSNNACDVQSISTCMEGGMQADLCPLRGSASVPPDALGSNWGQLRADFLPDGDLLIAFELHLTRTNAFHCASPKALLTEDAAQRLVCVCGGGGSPGDPSTLGKCRCGWPHTQTHPNYPEACIPYTYTIKPFHLLQWSSNRLLVYLS